MADVTAMLGKLRPVTFRYKQAQDDGAHPLQYGLIAEEVAEMFPDLAVFNGRRAGDGEVSPAAVVPAGRLPGAAEHDRGAGAEDGSRRPEEIDGSLKSGSRRLEALLPQTRAAALQ